MIRRAVSVAAATALLLTVGGCGSAVGAGGEDGGTTVMTWSPAGAAAADRPGVTALAEAIGKVANAKGGVAGHPLTVLTCNDRNTPDGAADCARQAVAAHAVAVIGAYSEYGDSFMPVLEQAGIPYLGGFGLSRPEFSSPLSYPVAGGTPALIAGSGRQLIAAGCRAVALVRPDTRTGDTLTGYLAAALKPAGVKPVDVKMPEKAADLRAVAAKAIGEDRTGDCVIDALDPARSLQLLGEYRTLGPKHVQLATVVGSVDQAAVDSLGKPGGPLDGALVTGWFPPESSGVWEELRATAGGDRRIQPTDLAVQTTWIAYQVFLGAADRLRSAGQPLTAKSLRSQLDSGDTLRTGGATPPVIWSMTDMLPSAETPRLVNTWVTFQQVKGGRLAQQQSGFVDVRWVLTGGRPPQ